jgi:hypothetical protein
MRNSSGSVLNQKQERRLWVILREADRLLSETEQMLKDVMLIHR